MGLQGKVAVVTGGGAGIGRSIVQRLAADGARVAALDIRLETAQKSIELAGGEGLAVVCDVSDSASVDAAIAQVEAELGPVDILVNNAGAIGMDHLRRVKPLVARQREEALNGGVKTPLDALVRLTDEEWRRMLAIHLDGTFYCTRAAVRSMAAARQRRGGQHVLDLRPRRLHRAPALLRRQGRDPGLHQGRGQGADRAGHPRQRGRARARGHEHAAGRDQRGAPGDSRTPRRPAGWPSRRRSPRRSRSSPPTTRATSSARS